MSLKILSEIRDKIAKVLSLINPNFPLKIPINIKKKYNKKSIFLFVFQNHHLFCSGLSQRSEHGSTLRYHR